jgi:hypothetical protein
MDTTVDIIAHIDQTIARLTAQRNDLEREMLADAELALADWLIVEACKDYDTIDLDPDMTGKTRRKQFKARREQKRNLEKIIVALQDLRAQAQDESGEKLRKKFESEAEKYR